MQMSQIFMSPRKATSSHPNANEVKTPTSFLFVVFIFMFLPDDFAHSIYLPKDAGTEPQASGSPQKYPLGNGRLEAR